MNCRAKSIAIGLLIALCGCGGSSVSPTGDFTVNSLLSSAAIQPGGNLVNNFFITPENGFNGRITLTINGIPEGLTFAPSPSQVTGPGAYTMTLSAAPDMALGTYTITFLFTSGHLQHSFDVVVTVEAELSKDLNNAQSPQISSARSRSNNLFC